MIRESIPDFMYNGIVALPKSVRFGVNGPIMSVYHNGNNASVSLPEGIEWKQIATTYHHDGVVDIVCH